MYSFQTLGFYNSGTRSLLCNVTSGEPAWETGIPILNQANGIIILCFRVCFMFRGALIRSRFSSLTLTLISFSACALEAGTLLFSFTYSSPDRGYLHVQTASIGCLGIMYRARIGRRSSGTVFLFLTWESTFDSERLGNNTRAATFCLFLSMGSSDEFPSWLGQESISQVSRSKCSTASLVRPSFTRYIRLCHDELERSADPLPF